MALFDEFKEYVDADVAAITRGAGYAARTDISLVSIDFDPGADEINEHRASSDLFELDVTANAVFDVDMHTVEFSWKYTISCEDDEECYVILDKPSQDLAIELADKIKALKGVKSATVANKQPIMAADDDDDLSEGFEDPVTPADSGGAVADGDDTVADAIDDLADNVEDIQDQVDDIQEDDVNIEIENNIDGHYIAECDKCHGIFISAMIQSDQEVEKISGVCPLCEKESEQYLRWVVTPVEKDEEQK